MTDTPFGMMDSFESRAVDQRQLAATVRLTLPSVYVIVLNWNAWPETLVCLDSLNSLRYENHRIVLVDNGSEDESFAGALEWLARAASLGESELMHKRLISAGADTSVTLIQPAVRSESDPANNKHPVLLRSEDNLGFAGGCNLGISYALQNDASFTFLLNNDARPEPKALAELVAVATESGASAIGAVIVDGTGTKVLYGGNRWPRQLFLSGGTRQRAGSKRYWASTEGQGSAVLLRRDLLDARFAESGYYLDPSLFMYCEETDLCVYGGKHGYISIIARDAIVHHAEAQSSGGQGNPRSLYYLTRNRIVLANRWLTTPWKILFHLYYVPSRLGILLLRRRHGTVRSVISALWDGYRGRSGKWNRHDLATGPHTHRRERQPRSINGEGRPKQ